MFKTKLKHANSIFLMLSILFLNIGMAQVKIGDNPHLLDASSILELEANNKALVLTRLSNIEMNNIVPLKGAIVYNTDENCLFFYDGTSWGNLCNSANINQQLSFNTSTNVMTLENGGTVDLSSIITTNLTADMVSYDNSSSVLLATDTQSALEEIDANTRAINLVDNGDGTYSFTNVTGIVTTISGASSIVLAGNGLTKTGNKIELGGTLEKATEISTTSVNTLAINGLTEDVISDTQIVAINSSTGILSKKNISSFVQEAVLNHIAITGQVTFTTPLPITDINKVNVYRNGIRLDFTFFNANTIQLESGVICYQDDAIKIIQFN